MRPMPRPRLMFASGCWTFNRSLFNGGAGRAPFIRQEVQQAIAVKLAKSVHEPMAYYQ